MLQSVCRCVGCTRSRAILGEKLITAKKMKFIEMTGATLESMLSEKELAELSGAGVNDNSIVRINQHGDIEVRREVKWDVIGGLLGNFEDRIKKQTGFEWA